MKDVKRCPDCKEVRPASDFGGKNPYYCRHCLNRRLREWRQKKRAEYLAEHPKVPRTDKTCRMCGIVKPVSEFNFCNSAKTLYASYCKPCSLLRAYADREKRGREDERLLYRCNRMGTTVEWYQNKLAEQDGVCAVCGSKETHPVDKVRHAGKIRNLAIDHDHETGEVRGLLCFRCNTSIHMLERYGFTWATSAVNYLTKYKQGNEA